MVAKWIRLSRGLLQIEVRGAELERFLNVCAQNHIRLYEPKRMDIDRMQAMLSIFDYYALAQLRRRTRCQVHILSRRGLPFVLRRLRRRYALWGGILLMCLVCWELSSRVWLIETDIPPQLEEAVMLDELENMGIGIGTKRSDIDAHAVKVHMLNTFDDIKFFALNLDGNIMSVEAEAATKAPTMELSEGVHTVVAVRDGVIQKQIVHAGTERFKVGDAVLAGEVLVDALVEPKTDWGKSRLVDASADIWAVTRQVKTRKMLLAADKKQKTGKRKTKYALCFGKTRINLYFGSSLTEGNCDKIISVQSVRLNAHLALPISLYTETTEYYTAEPMDYTAEELRAKLEYGARRSAEQTLREGNVTSVQADVQAENGAAVLHGTVWCYEQIGETVEDDRTEADLIQPEQETDGEPAE